ncbi:MAG: LPS export ABC transporter periplasmic protein LptC [Alphaproteobacteria bacterium]|nr:LPS export ABC transporter periplasmic protein LptC [Alphaproteobacteria bacterium]
MMTIAKDRGGRPRLGFGGAHLRRDAAHHSRAYSRFVGLMKFLLPTVALALIVSILVWPQLVGREEGSFRFSFADLERDPDGAVGVTKARFAGTDSANRPFVVAAERALQKQGFDVFALTTLQADITLADGTWLSITADTGEYERARQLLTLGGVIDIFSNVGYEMHATHAVVNLATGTVESAQPVQGHGPLGAMRADTMKYTAEGKRLQLTGGVRVVLNTRSQG